MKHKVNKVLLNKSLTKLSKHNKLLRKTIQQLRMLKQPLTKHNNKLITNNKLLMTHKLLSIMTHKMYNKNARNPARLVVQPALYQLEEI